MKNSGCGTIIAIIFGIILLAFALSCLQAALALWLWSAIVVVAFGVPALSFWQMFGLIWLIHIFFGASYISSAASKKGE